MKFSTKIIVSFFLISSFAVLTSASLLKHTQIPIKACTGAPGDSTCQNCHGSFTLNSGSGTLAMTFSDPSDIYTPGFTYNMTVTMTDATKSKFGFEMVALNSSNANIGTFIVTDAAHTFIQTAASTGRKYIGQFHASGTNTWSFKWTAPASNVGNIKFYLAGCAANHDSSSANDLVYTINHTITPSATSVSNSAIGIGSVLVYPTIISQNFSVEFNAEKSSELISSLYDLSGKNVQSFSTEQIISGNNKINFELKNEIPAGIYLLHLSSNGEQTTRRIIVQ